MIRRIVFITDCVDVAYSELRGTVWRTLGDHAGRVDVEPVVQVTPFSIINGDFLVRLMAHSYPEGTVLSVILNPSKLRPQRIFGRTRDKGIVFIGANTGAFTSLIREYGLEHVYELDDPGFVPFGGKYVHAPAAARLALGTPFNEMGVPFPPENMLLLDTPQGTIVHIDNFGIMKFTGSVTGLAEGDMLEIAIGSTLLNGIYTSRMMNLETGEWAIYRGSSFDYLELGKVRENGAASLKASVGDIVRFQKAK